jgi:hypothetical protein
MLNHEDRYLSYVKVRIRILLKVCVVMAKIEDLQARSIDNVFDSKEKVNKNISEHKVENLVNISGIDWNIEEWEVE